MPLSRNKSLLNNHKIMNKKAYIDKKKPFLSSVGRDATFDIARSFCILWIVCLLHITTYIETAWISELGWSLLVKMTYASLGTFTFISGYFLKKKEITNVADIKKFYFTRFKRFWIPFFISALTLWFIGGVVGKPWFTSTLNFVLSLVGLSCFWGPLPSTLWFMVMMVLCYLFTPVLLYKSNQGQRIVRSVLLMSILIAIYILGHLDERLLVYIPMYLLGLCLPDTFTKAIRNHKTVVIIVTALLLGAVIATNTLEGLLLYYVVVPIGYMFIIGLSETLSSLMWVRDVSSIVSYSSMNMYFFHRQMYLCAIFLFNISMFPNFHGATMPLWFAIIVVIPIIITVSYFLQKGYDRLLKMIKI